MIKSETSDWLKIFQGILCVLTITTTMNADSLKGQAAYEVNCKACHLVETTLVGPSLIEISKNYPEEKLNDFLSWAKSPGKKNPGMIQMPSMAHLSDQTLKEIFDYLKVATLGKEEKRRSTLFARFKEPERELPYVVRGFFPDSSPASIAIVMKGNVSAVWDADACRFRYAWSGKKTNFNSNFGIRKLENNPFYEEISSNLWVSLEDVQPEFLGYRLIEGYPEFHYKLGALEVRELVTNGSSKDSILRHFSLSGPVDSITLDLNYEGEVIISSDKGRLNGNLLTLEGIQNFTLNLTRK